MKTSAMRRSMVRYEASNHCRITGGDESTADIGRAQSNSIHLRLEDIGSPVDRGLLPARCCSPAQRSQLRKTLSAVSNWANGLNERPGASGPGARAIHYAHEAMQCCVGAAEEFRRARGLQVRLATNSPEFSAVRLPPMKLLLKKPMPVALAMALVLVAVVTVSSEQDSVLTLAGTITV